MKPRTMHFLLKSVEEGISDFDELPPTFSVAPNFDLIPSRLTLFMYENKISERWNGIFLGESLSIRTVTRIRKIAEKYTEKNGYDFVIIDTSPSLGALNKIIISTVDGFSIISQEKRKEFPAEFVKFLGYTIYNAKKYEKNNNKWELAKAHYHYAQQIPEIIKEHINIKNHLTEEMIQQPIGGISVMHSHNTRTSSAQQKKTPVWKTVSNPERQEIIDKYKVFANDLLERMATLDKK
jgi:cellulose biosynthesis protein BcsQ